MNNQDAINNFKQNSLVRNQFSYSYLTDDGSISSFPNVLEPNFTGPLKQICYVSGLGNTSTVIPNTTTTCTKLKGNLLQVSVQPNPDITDPYITAKIYDSKYNQLDITNATSYSNVSYLVFDYNPPTPPGTPIWVYIGIIFAVLLIIAGVWYFFIRKSPQNIEQTPILNPLKGGLFYLGE